MVIQDDLKCVEPKTFSYKSQNQLKCSFYSTSVKFILTPKELSRPSMKPLRSIDPNPFIGVMAQPYLNVHCMLQHRTTIQNI